MNSDQIKQLITKYWTKKRWAVHAEVGLCKGGRLRADLVAISMGSQIAIIEVKSSVADFKNDKKVLGYAAYCDTLYFAMSSEVYQKVKHLVPSSIGVFVVTTHLKVRICKRARRNGVQPETRLNVVTRMAYRSADFTLHHRKSKTYGANFLAKLVVSTIREQPKPRKEQHIVHALTAALTNYV